MKNISLGSKFKILVIVKQQRIIAELVLLQDGKLIHLTSKIQFLTALKECILALLIILTTVKDSVDTFWIIDQVSLF